MVRRGPWGPWSCWSTVRLSAYLARGDRQLLTWLPEAEPQRRKRHGRCARALIERARSGGETPRGMLIEEIDGGPAAAHALAPFLAEAGFLSGAFGFSPQDPQILRSLRP